MSEEEIKAEDVIVEGDESVDSGEVLEEVRSEEVVA